MRKIWVAGLALALATASPALAKGHGHGWHKGGGSFGTETLQGTYIFEANGFADDTKPGGAGILGTLTFDGNGGVTGDVTLTEADSGQVSCDDSFTSGGSYTVNSAAPGTGTLTLPLTAGAINFNLLIPSPSGKGALALESDAAPFAPGSVMICTQSMTTMVLKGHLKRVESEGEGD